MGVGVVDSVGDALSLVYSGALSPRRAAPLSQRLHYLYAQLLSLIQAWGPSAVAIEEPFVSRNVRAAMAVGQAQGVAAVAAAHYGLPVSTYSPMEIKRAVADHGASSKAQVQAMVGVLLGLPDGSGPPPDAADALAVAICHIGASRAEQLIIGE